MKSKIDSGRMMSRVAALQEENESLHAQYFPTKKSKQILWIKNFIRRQIDKEKTV